MEGMVFVENKTISVNFIFILITWQIAVLHIQYQKMKNKQSKSQKIDKRNPEKAQFSEQQYRTPQRIIKSNHSSQYELKSTPQKMQLNRQYYKHIDLSQVDQSSLMRQQVRIKGQAKLLYLKKCKLKKIEGQQMFIHYPYCNMESFVFNYSSLFNQGRMIQNQEGIHLIEDIKLSQQQDSENNTENYEISSQFNGLALSIFNDGRIFQGKYLNGTFCGIGYQLNTNGNTYIGNFKDGLMHGSGTFYQFNHEETYAGDWLGGLPHGKGLYIGKGKYEGNFVNGKKYGEGLEYFSNGDYYVGEYVNGEPEGYGQYFWADDSVYKGNFKQGLRHGYGIWKDDKQIYQGMYRMDKKEGFGIYKWIDKQIYKGQFKSDYRQGYGELYNLSKNESSILIYKGCWLKGKKDQNRIIDQNSKRECIKFLNKLIGIQRPKKQNSSQPKQRIGHKNCIPIQTPQHKKHIMYT